MPRPCWCLPPPRWRSSGGRLARPRARLLSNDPTDRALWVGEMAALALVAAGVVWERVRARRARSALARLVVDLGASPLPGGLEGQLADALGDPSLSCSTPRR